MSFLIHSGENCNFLKSQPSVKMSDYTGKKQTMFFHNPVHIVSHTAVVSEKESQGPLGKYFKNVIQDMKMNEKCFENAEISMLNEAVQYAIDEAKLSVKDIDVLLSGDLLNQITSSNFVARNLNIPHLGLYSACSTMTEALSLGASMVNAGYYNTVACATVSHFATAERQFRYPLEYGCQRPPYAQWTVTASGCCVLSSVGDGPVITSATLGKVIDYGTTDLSNMGAAMAPAAMDTLCAMFKDTKTSPSDYDMIFTGDLGKLGSDILRDLMDERGYILGQNYTDCGCLIYSIDQNCYQGGSGCGCSASVINAFALQKMKEGQFKKIAYIATGALMSTQSCYQGETIPCVSHAVIIESDKHK